MIINFCDLHLTDLDSRSIAEQIGKLTMDEYYLDRSDHYEKLRQNINALFYNGFLTSNEYNKMLERLYNYIINDVKKVVINSEVEFLPF